MFETIILKPIAYVRHSYTDDEVRNSLSGVDGVIEILPEFEECVYGLEGFSHIIIVAYLHKIDENSRKIFKVKPRGLAKKLGLSIEELPTVGVFATDSPYRPNPIAISITRLLKIKNNFLYVDNLDLFNNTPVLDIKPYTLARCVENVELPQWYKDLLNKISAKR